MAKITRWPRAGRIQWRRLSLAVTDRDRVRKKRFTPSYRTHPASSPRSNAAAAAGIAVPAGHPANLRRDRVSGMPDTVLYTAEAVSTGDGRNGHVASSDQRIDLDLAMPPELGGTGAGTNPEQLFAAAYAACFHSALRLVAGRQHTPLGDSTVTAEVGIGPDGEAFGLVVTLVIHVPGLEREKVREFADEAHQVCPYSRATRGNISVELRVL